VEPASQHGHPDTAQEKYFQNPTHKTGVMNNFIFDEDDGTLRLKIDQEQKKIHSVDLMTAGTRDQ
jgi:hypothetical protein